jgi:hypothetical protein
MALPAWSIDYSGIPNTLNDILRQNIENRKWKETQALQQQNTEADRALRERNLSMDEQEFARKKKELQDWEQTRSSLATQFQQQPSAAAFPSPAPVVGRQDTIQSSANRGLIVPPAGRLPGAANAPASLLLNAPRGQAAFASFTDPVSAAEDHYRAQLSLAQSYRQYALMPGISREQAVPMLEKAAEIERKARPEANTLGLGILRANTAESQAKASADRTHHLATLGEQRLKAQADRDIKKHEWELKKEADKEKAREKMFKLQQQGRMELETAKTGRQKGIAREKLMSAEALSELTQAGTDARDAMGIIARANEGNAKDQREVLIRSSQITPEQKMDLIQGKTPVKTLWQTITGQSLPSAVKTPGTEEGMPLTPAQVAMQKAEIAKRRAKLHLEQLQRSRR